MIHCFTPPGDQLRYHMSEMELFPLKKACAVAPVKHMARSSAITPNICRVARISRLDALLTTEDEDDK